MNSLQSMMDQIAEASLAREAEDLGISVEEVKKLRKERHEKRLVENAKKAEIRREQQEKENAAEFLRRKQLGQTLGFDVAVHIGNIVNIGGLTERSMGGGEVSNTVQHLVFDEHYESGRLKRESGDLLCKKRSQLGRRTMGVSGTNAWSGDTSRDHTIGEVTCKACLQKLKSKFKG